MRKWDDLPPRGIPHDVPIQYEADGFSANWPKLPTNPLGRYRHARFMPRWASRLALEITSVKVERLQAMSFDDWVADFCPSYVEQEKARISFTGWDNQRTMAAESWDKINGRRFPWVSNPWVWAVSFRRTG
jgi:hypothetical protein